MTLGLGDIQEAIQRGIERRATTSMSAPLSRPSSSSSLLSLSAAPIPTGPKLDNLCNDLPLDAFPAFDLPANISDLKFETIGAWWAAKVAELESVLYDQDVSEKTFVRKLLYKVDPLLSRGNGQAHDKAKQDNAICVSYVNRYCTLLNQKLLELKLDPVRVPQLTYALKQYATSPNRSIVLMLKKGDGAFPGRSSRAFDFYTQGFPGVSSNIPPALLDLEDTQLDAAEKPSADLADLDPEGAWRDWFGERIVEIVKFLYSTDEITKSTLLRTVFEKIARPGDVFSLETQSLLVKGCFLAFSGTIQTDVISACPFDEEAQPDENLRWKTCINRLMTKLFEKPDAFYPQIRRALLRKDKEMALKLGAENTYEQELKSIIAAKVRQNSKIEMDALLEHVYSLLYSSDGSSGKFWIQTLLEKDMCYDKHDESLYHFNNKYEVRYFSLLLDHIVAAEKLRRGIFDKEVDEVKARFLTTKMVQHQRKAMEELARISDLSSELLSMVDQIDVKPDDRISVEQSFQTLQIEVIRAYAPGRWLSPAEKTQLLANTVAIAEISKATTAQFNPEQKSFVRAMIDAFYKALKAVFFAQTPLELKEELKAGASRSTAKTRTRRVSTVGAPAWFESLYEHKREQYTCGFNDLISRNAPPPRPLPFVPAVA